MRGGSRVRSIWVFVFFLGGGGNLNFNFQTPNTFHQNYIKYVKQNLKEFGVGPSSRENDICQKIQTFRFHRGPEKKTTLVICFEEVAGVLDPLAIHQSPEVVRQDPKKAVYIGFL